MPLELKALEQTVCAALKAAEAALWTAAKASTDDAVLAAKEAADAARESTFPYIQRMELSYNGAYAAAGLQYAAALTIEAAQLAESPAACSEAASAALRALDLAMLRGGVDDWARPAEPLVRAAHGWLGRHHHDAPAPSPDDGGAHAARDDGRAAGHDGAHDAAESESHRKRLEEACAHFSAGASQPECTLIPRLDARTLTVAAFQARFMRSSPAPTPVILTHAIDDWPARSDRGGRRWSLEYLRRMAGGRLVPVETYADADATSTYLSQSWEREVMTLAEYLDRYVVPQATGTSRAADGALQEDGGTGPGTGGGERGYLAQHPLLDQIPILRDDVRTPSFCSATSEADENAPSECEVREAPLASAWFGPAGTVSPLHNDPFHNLLAQVVGSKYVRLIDARYAPRLYPRSGALCNNSHVDLDQPSPSEHPLFRGTPFWQAVLLPSEVLYIPRLCWHYVRSLEVSLSVSFWWGARMAIRRKPDGTTEETF